MNQEWFETFFDGLALEFWNRAIPAEVTDLEVKFLEAALELTKGARVVDVPCGSGRHAIPLAQRGCRVTAVDLSEVFLDDGRAANSQIDWRRGDMRDLRLEAGAFDAALCMGNSFGYLNHAEAGAFLRSLATALRPGGRLVIDSPVTAESILPTMVPQRWHHPSEDLYVLSAAKYAASESRLDVDYTFLYQGKAETRPTRSYVTTAAELQRMLDAAGLDTVRIEGGFAGEPFRLGSRLILTAQRR